MSCEHSKGKPMIKVVSIVVVMCLASWSMYSYFQIRKLEQEMAAKQIRSEMMQLQRDLQVPSEMLYFDYVNLQKELVELRFKSYTNYGLTTYLPYTNLITADRWASSNGQDEFPVETAWNLGNVSPERYWLNAVRQPCHHLAYQINRDAELGAYLKHHPEEFDLYIRPFLVRLLDAYAPSITCQASEVLLAMGDRSEQLIEILSILSRLDYHDAEEAQDLAKEYGLVLKSGEVMITQKEPIVKFNPEWKRIHELTKELKAKYPLLATSHLVPIGNN